MKTDIMELKDTLTFINLRLDELRVMLNCIVKLMTYFSQEIENQIYTVDSVIIKREESNK
ncbi:unnamed protein product [marine sediment metagenome]|uniref:Uncharacterized protein n=1 Tax=marine sediment metagenome TaxID=412755 RepID=X1G808_9ZZZZ